MATKSPITLTLREVLELYRIGLKGLDGFPKAVGEKIMLQPFKLADEVRQRIAKNLRILKSFLELEEEIQLTLFREITGNSEATFIPQGDDAMQSLYAKRYRDMMSIPQDVELFMFKREELFVDNKNPIPGSVEDALAPIIEGAIEPKKQAVSAAPAPAAPSEPAGGDDGK